MPSGQAMLELKNKQNCPSQVDGWMRVRSARSGEKRVTDDNASRSTSHIGYQHFWVHIHCSLLRTNVVNVTPHMHTARRLSSDTPHRHARPCERFFTMA